MILTESRNIAELFRERVRHSGASPAIRFKRRGTFVSRTWNELWDDVCRMAEVLRRLGVEPGDRVVQFSENRFEWILADLAIQCLRAVHVPAHAPLTGPQVAYQIQDSGAKVVLISSSQQAEKLMPVLGQFSTLPQFVTYEPCDLPLGAAPPRQLPELLNGVPVRPGAELAHAAARQADDQLLATILYTSGTTGEPKGVMLHQRNLVSNVIASVAAFEQRADDVRLCFLPLSHIFARTCDLYAWICAGSVLGLAESRETVLDDAARIAPTVMNGVPYFYDRLRRVLVDSGRADEPEAPRRMLGGRVRYVCSGGAALPNPVFDFFHERGLKVLQGYGLTESSPVISLSTEAAYRRGSVGQAVAGVEIRVADDGEILARGPNIMLGYWNKPAETADVVRDGWLHTGDLGRLDGEGYLYITGRKKEILVTAGGKNVAPILLESLLNEDPLILQSLVIGDDRNFLTALIVPDGEALRAELLRRKIVVQSPREALQNADVLRLYQARIKERLKDLSAYEQIGKFTLIERPFSIERGEMTPKLSLRRRAIEANFAAEIEAMYRADGTK